jgi:hypothetical protein
MAVRFTRSMRRSTVTALIAGTVLTCTLASAPDIAAAQVDCAAIPAGPARTDCYIGLSRLFGQKSEVAGTAAKQKASASKYLQITGTSAKPRKKQRRKRPVR